MSSAAEYYVQNTDHYLWEHMKKYSLETLEDGIRGLKYDSLSLSFFKYFFTFNLFHLEMEAWTC